MAGSHGDVSDLLLSDIHRTSNKDTFYKALVSDLLLSDKRKHPLTALIGNEGMLSIRDNQ